VDTSEHFIKRKAIPKIHQKYQGNDFIYHETLKDETLNAWQRFKRWLAEKIQELFDLDTPQESKDAVSIILKILGVLLILFVLYKIVNAYMNDEGNWVFGRKSDKVIINAAELENNIHKTDFNTLIEEALLKDNYRLAIRYYYLLSLKQLANKEKIEWDSEKTNYDYYQEIKDKTLKKQFQYISYIYDYCWYGEFNIEKTEFNTSEKAFKKLTDLIN
jgi:hypothetical protein